MAYAVEGFNFGENWSRFLADIDEGRITTAEASLKTLVGRDRLDGLSFLDIGCGSGLFSLAAHRLGARVHSFDYNPQCAACAETLKGRYASRPDRWMIEQGSILDPDYVAKLGTFDIVYSWGVLHHTGAMWKAIRYAISLVKPGGRLVIAIYRKTPTCAFWKFEKRLYISAPQSVKRALDCCLAAAMVGALALTGRNPVSYIRDYRRMRGMTFMTDVRDWLGGYPYESASPAEVTNFARSLGLSQERFSPCNTRIGLLGVGCDQYVLRAP